jgi:hypothetical protein
MEFSTDSCAMPQRSARIASLAHLPTMDTTSACAVAPCTRAHRLPLTFCRSDDWTLATDIAVQFDAQAVPAVKTRGLRKRKFDTRQNRRVRNDSVAPMTTRQRSKPSSRAEDKSSDGVALPTSGSGHSYLIEISLVVALRPQKPSPPRGTWRNRASLITHKVSSDRLD